MKIAAFEVEPWECSAFGPLSRSHEIVFSEGVLNAETASAYEKAEIISIFIYSRIDAAVLDRLPSLRFIATRSTGFDHIDVPECTRRDVSISNVPRYGESTVAEHVFGLILMISHRLAESIDRTRKGDFSLKGLRGFDLRHKTLGVIGTGAIGRNVIEIASGFRMRVLAFDLRPDHELERLLGFTYSSFEDLLAHSDIVSLHVPAAPGAGHLIASREFEIMKRGAVLINTARGSLIDVEALLHALAAGRISAAGLDVLPEEPAIREEAELLRSFFRKNYDLSTLLADHILLRMRNVYITPHNAFNTREAVERILGTTIENIQAYIHGNQLNPVPS
ncbi:MAG: hydroxyacid dehydrogenase [Syntrophales bacterium]|nr:hydroxyacid dehydrogenase [Syntrophales bacterium]